MRVRTQPLDQRVLAVLALPDLGPGEKEALVAGEAVDDRGLLAAERLAIGAISQRHAADIADVLAQGEPAVDEVARHRLELGILIGYHRGLVFEIGAVRVGPPVALDAGPVGFRALVVEPVAHLMADHRADAAVIHRRIRGRVEERRLQDARGEDDFVERGIVIGVHRLRRHAPFLAVGGLADALDFFLVAKLAHVAGVIE